jgi:hypothetical protein
MPGDITMAGEESSPMASVGRAGLAGLPDYVAGRKIPGAIVLPGNEVPYDPPVS